MLKDTTQRPRLGSNSQNWDQESDTLPTELCVLPITNSETMHFYRDNNVFEIVTNKFIQSNFNQLFDIKVFTQKYVVCVIYMKFIEHVEKNSFKAHLKISHKMTCNTP